MTEIKNADVLEDIKTYQDYFFDIIYSDPPYNLASTWFIDTDGQYKIKRKSKDFLSKWDGLTEKEFDIFFKESFRTLKYGGYLIMYGMDRQLGPFHYYAVKNGFEVCQSLYWFFLSSFPKASDVSKQISKKIGEEREVIGQGKAGFLEKNNVFDFDKEGYGTYDISVSNNPIAKKYEGYKYSIAPLKQVLETIMVFHKPIKGKSYIDDIIECETNNDIHSSCLNIDGERVEYKDDKPDPAHRDCNNNRDITFTMGFTQNSGWHYDPSETGRFPSQLLVDENAAKIIDEQTGIRSGGKYTNRSNNSNTYLGNIVVKIVKLVKIIQMAAVQKYYILVNMKLMKLTY